MKIKVKDLIKFLQQFPKDSKILSLGQDSGGYDVEIGYINNIKKIKGMPVIFYSGDDEYSEYLENDCINFLGEQGGN
jgi:hypothetical protein